MLSEEVQRTHLCTPKEALDTSSHSAECIRRSPFVENLGRLSEDPGPSAHQTSNSAGRARCSHTSLGKTPTLQAVVGNSGNSRTFPDFHGKSKTSHERLGFPAVAAKPASAPHNGTSHILLINASAEAHVHCNLAKSTLEKKRGPGLQAWRVTRPEQGAEVLAWISEAVWTCRVLMP